jgi:hypothetical protein
MNVLILTFLVLITLGSRLNEQTYIERKLVEQEKAKLDAQHEIQNFDDPKFNTHKGEVNPETAKAPANKIPASGGSTLEIHPDTPAMYPTTAHALPVGEAHP